MSESTRIRSASVLSVLAMLLVAVLASCRTAECGNHAHHSLSEDARLEANKVLGRVWFEQVVTGRDPSAIDRHYAKDYVHHSAEGREIHGLEATKAFAKTLLAASSDRVATVEQQVAEGDLVVTRFVSRGTHTGTFRGKEPTGELWVTEGICISRIEDGKIAEDWEIIHVSGL